MKQLLNKQGIAGIILVAITSLVYLTSLPNAFVYDDYDYVVENKLVAAPSFSLIEVFTTPYPPHHPEQNLYRPIVTLTYLWDKTLWGIPPEPAKMATLFHLTNLLLHLGTVVMLYLLILKLPPVNSSPSRIVIAAFCAGLYGVHPLTTESVAWISGRAEILSAFWSLLSLSCLLNGIRAGSKGFVWIFGGWIVFILALFSKENALILPGLVVLLMIWLSRYETFEWKKVWIAPAGYCLLAMLYYSSRSHIFGGIPMEELAYAGIADPLTRVLVACKVMLRYLWMAFIPYGQSVFHEVEMERLISFICFLILAGLLIAAVSLKKKAPWFLFGLSFFFIALFPVSNLLVPIGTVIAERFLYLPLAGLVIALAFALATSGKPLPWMTGVILATVILHHGIKTAVRNTDWKNESTLWAAAEKIYPNAFIVQAQRGFAEAAFGRFPESYRALERAGILLSLQPEIYQDKFATRILLKKQEVWTRLSSAPDAPELMKIHEIARSGKLREAALLYAVYLDANPGSVSAHQSLIDCLMRLGSFREAAHELRKLIKMSPDNGLLYGKLGFCQAQMSQFALARVNYKKALELNPSDSVSLANLGILEMRQQNYQLALHYFQRASELQPGNPEYLYNLAGCQGALGETSRARETLRKLLRSHPEYEPAKKLIKTLK